MIEVGKHSDLIGWDDVLDQENFDLVVNSRLFDPDTVTVSIYGTKYTFFSTFDNIELFLKLYRLGAKGQALAFLKENDKKLQLVVLEFKGLSSSDEKFLIITLDKIADSSRQSTQNHAGTLYYDQDVVDKDIDLITQTIEDLNFEVRDISKKYKKLSISKSS